MKLNKLTKGLFAAAALSAAGFANAGVVATSYISVNELSIEVDVDGDGFADALPPGVELSDIVAVINSTRGGNTASNYSGYADDSDGDDSASASLPDVDAELACSGPDCGGLVDNFFSDDGVIADSSMNYAVGDMFVGGSALEGGASGFTYADAATTTVHTQAGGSGTITNTLMAQLVFNQDVNVRLVGNYDIFAETDVTADVLANDQVTGTATAGSTFLATLGTAIVVDGATDTLDVAAERDENVAFTSAWTFFTAGSFGLLNINQSSTANVSLVSEPASLALFGLGLIGLAGAARRRKA